MPTRVSTFTSSGACCAASLETPSSLRRAPSFALPRSQAKGYCITPKIFRARRKYEIHSHKHRHGSSSHQMRKPCALSEQGQLSSIMMPVHSPAPPLTPSTKASDPVWYEEYPERKRRTWEACSKGMEKRPRGTWAACAARRSAGICAVWSVSMKPGESMLTRICAAGGRGRAGAVSEVSE